MKVGMKSHQIAGLGPGRYGVGDRLYLRVDKAGNRSWTFLFTSPSTGKRREMGIGSHPTVGLTAAKERRDALNAQLRDGVDPMEKQTATVVGPILADLAHAAFAAQRGKLKGDGIAGRWFSPLERHVLPVLGQRDVTDLTQHDVVDMIRPLWKTKNPTAQKCLDRLQIVLKYASAADIPVDLQIVTKARHLLGESGHTVQHIPAMPYADVPAFYATLSDTVVSHLALRLLILTGVRTMGVRFARVEHFTDDVWMIPADLMKGERGKTSDFRVPLSDAAQHVVQTAIATTARDGFLFPGGGSAKRTAKPISDATMSKAMRVAGIDYRPHGFRSSLKQWMVQTTATPWEVGETILAHHTENKVGRAYSRDADYLAQRRVVMEQWAAFVTGGNDVVTDHRTELEAELQRIKNLLADMPNS